MNLTILGCSSATPTSQRFPSAQILNLNEKFYLIDCGEGTQMQLRKFGFKFQKINNIFISHLHGDHYLGLMGLIFTQHLFGRKNELNIYCPKGLNEIINLQLEVSKTNLLYPLKVNEISSSVPEIIYEGNDIIVTSFPLLHRIPTYGFLFSEKEKPRNIRKEVIMEMDIPVDEFDKIKNGADYTDKNGTLFTNQQLTNTPPPSKSFAYCSDTGYCESIIPTIKNVDLLYHEATFMNEREKDAIEKQHSTTIQAATIALKANVKKLIIGHYSARYEELEPMLLETQSIFNNSELGEEGKTHEID